MMDWFVKAFLKAALAWLGLGVVLGLAMAVQPQWVVYRPAHMHMNLAGFVAMMIFGVAYHVLPRFTGNPLYSQRMAGLHWWLANTGLVLLAGGLALRLYLGHAATPIIAVGGLLWAAGAFSFIVNIWVTLDGRSKPVARVAPQPEVVVRHLRLRDRA